MRTLDKSYFSGSTVTLKPQKFSTPELESGSVAYVAALTANERDLLEMQWQAYKKKRNDKPVGARAFIVAFCLCDENNARMFDSGDERDASPEFIETVNVIGRMPVKTIARGFNAASELNGMTDEDVEELEKNLEATAGVCGNGATPHSQASVVASG